MSFLNVRQQIKSRAAAALPTRVKNSAFANNVIAPVLANHAPWLLTPYLGMRARLSQIWINRWTVLLILCLVRTLIGIASMHDGINSARREALSACTGIESAGSAMASMPHYMSQGVNALTAHGVEKAINGLMSMLTLSVTGVEEIVVFVINLLTSTYVCLITLVVAGSLHAAIALIEDVTGFLNKTLGAIGDDIQGAVTDFEKGLNGIIGGLNSIGNAFGDHHDIPTLNVNNQIAALHDLHLPSGLTADLDKLNASIPTFAQVNNFTNSAIRFPFEEIKTLITNHTGHYVFDQSLFPVPAKQQLTFCSGDDGIDPFFNGLVDLIYEARQIAVGVLVTLALVVIIPMAYREQRAHRIQQYRAARMSRGHEPMDVVYLASRPTSAGAGLALARKVKTDRKQMLIRWAIAYATTVPALFVLSLAIAGLFSCLCRYIVLQTVTKAIPDLVHDIDGFADKVMVSLNNASIAWANGSNTMILDMNARINHDIFGWVNISTHALNDTLNIFVDESIRVLNETFGGTILYDPVTELFNCLIGLKVAGIEKALTWISDNAHVDFPLLPANTFSLGAAASLAANNTSNSTASGQSASDLLSSPANGTHDAVSEAVHALIDHVYKSICTEALISTGVLVVWLIIALTGVIRAASLFYGKGNTADMGSDISPDTDPRTPVERYSGSFVSAESPPHNPEYDNETKEPTLPAVGVLDEKRTMASKLTPTMDPFADPRDPPQPPQPRRTQVPPPPQSQMQPQSQVQKPAAALHPPRPRSTTLDAANTYRGAPYTLQPQPYPRFSPHQASPLDTAAMRGISPRSKSADGDERTGAVKALGVGDAICRPGPGSRTSSQAELRTQGQARPDGRVTFEGLGH